MKYIFRLSRSSTERGQGFAEYALLLVFISISTILVIAALNSVIEDQFEDINKCIHNSGSRALTSSTCEEAESLPTRHRLQ
jgi:Flp pilus assembly pilin Flp